MNQACAQFFHTTREPEFHYFPRQYLEPENGCVQCDTRWCMLVANDHHRLALDQTQRQQLHAVAKRTSVARVGMKQVF